MYGQLGETYTSAVRMKSNLKVVHVICELLDEMRPRRNGQSFAKQIKFVKARAGHDRRYAIDARKVEQQLNSLPRETFGSGIRKTVAWYLQHEGWVTNVITVAYREWINTQYA
jgi:dTDP-glucose 4,6-dehydratase